MMKAEGLAHNSFPLLPRSTLALVLLLICLATYANSFTNGFLMDDLPNLIENAEIGSAQFLHLDVRSLKAQAYFRPGTHLLNLITFSCFGTHPAGYHLTNLILLYLAALTLWALVEKLLNNRVAAFLAGVFFCVHPINGVLVNYKNASAYPFLIFAMNLSLLNLIAASGSKENKSRHVLSVLWFLAALSCHELVVFYPLYALAALVLAKKFRPGQAVTTCLPVLITLFGYLVFRFAFSPPSIPSHASLFPGLTPLNYLAALARLIFWYLSNLIVPRNIVLAWDTPLNGAHPWPWTLLLALFFLFPLILRKIKAGPPVLLAAAWISIGLLPLTLAAFSRPRLGFVVEPHWLVYSSIGFFLLVASWLAQAEARLSKWLWRAVVVVLATCYVCSSWIYNGRWANERRYCQYWLSVSPDNFMPNYWLGHALIEAKEYEKAKGSFEKILRLGHRYYETYGSMGYLEYQLGRDLPALSYFQESLRLNPRHADTYYYLGMCYQRLGQKGLAEKYFRATLALEPNHVDAKTALSDLK